jgi:hypothetical protein
MYFEMISWSSKKLGSDKKFLASNQSENTTYLNLELVKAVLKGKFISIHTLIKNQRYLK